MKPEKDTEKNDLIGYKKLGMTLYAFTILTAVFVLFSNSIISPSLYDYNIARAVIIVFILNSFIKVSFYLFDK